MRKASPEKECLCSQSAEKTVLCMYTQCYPPISMIFMFDKVRPKSSAQEPDPNQKSSSK